MELYPEKGDVSFISQSGSLCSALTSNMAIRGCGISKYISIGNKTDINVADIVEYLGEDAHTSCIALYVEDISDGRSLLKTATGIAGGHFTGIEPLGIPALVSTGGGPLALSSAALSATRTWRLPSMFSDVAFADTAPVSGSTASSPR